MHGVSTRSVDDLVAALGIDSGISKSEVSRICAGRGEVVGAFRTRPLDHTAFPYVYLDATYLHVRGQLLFAGDLDGGRGRHGDHRRGCAVRSAPASGWYPQASMSGTVRTRCSGAASSASLKKRGLSGVRLVISDQHAGLVAALRRSFQGSGHQRCRVHFARNLLAHVPKSHSDMVAAVLRTIFAQPDPATAASASDEGASPLSEDILDTGS